MAEASSSTSPSAAAQDDKPVQPAGTYSLEQLKEHNTRESLWMLLHDKVYDITAFMDEHPGGDEVLVEEAGRDATEAFEDVGHSDEAREMLPKMLLGDFYGEKKTKTKKAVSSTGGSTSSSGFPIWVVPVALVAAFLAWRVFLA
ncbi:uncharacterized protein I303_102546 [Kwoniella dejecticola CBS 10117]|uniref:Cytochrome b5 n=1 Tax=Kwoniella dejecticola CBS 10117 TaxID=1296121 RepID=A0A1A6A923_9TREE|nr:cytochrome b5 [Kwoniella dejecticola CBS 10117]OBR86552.1 cytochrome b5 [Kwoniella dejecticola CBS 10117]